MFGWSLECGFNVGRRLLGCRVVGGYLFVIVVVVGFFSDS